MENVPNHQPVIVYSLCKTHDCFAAWINISQSVVKKNKVYQCIKLQHTSADFVLVVIFLCLLIIGGSYPHLAITLWLFNIAMEHGPILSDL